MAAEFSLEEALGQGTGQPVEFSLEEALGKTPAVSEKDRESTFGSELVRGGKQLASSFRTGIGSLVGSPEEAARAGVQRSEAIAKEAGEGASLEAVKRAYQEKGLLSAAGEVASQTPRALASQAAQLALMAGGAKAGALAGTAVAPGIGTVIGGALGAGATLLPQLFGSNVERQASEQMAGKEEVDINRLAAGAGAVGQTALETAGPALILGKRLVKGLLGITDDAALVTAKAQQKTIDAANRSLLSASGRGAVRGAAVEIPVEVASSIIERAQAGLDVTSPDAFTEYGEVIYQSALIGGPLGAASGAADTSLARQTVKTQPSGPLQQVQEERDQFAKEFGEGTPVDAVAPDAVSGLAPEPAPVAAVDLPGGFTVTQRELSREEVPESFGIFAEGSDKPLTTVATQADIDAKITSLTEIRAEEQARLLKESDAITKNILAEQRKIDVMEATGQTDTDEYVQAKALLAQKELTAAEQIQDLNDKIASYSAPLSFAPIGLKTNIQSDFVATRGDEIVGTYPTFEEAEATLRAAEPEVFKQADIEAQTLQAQAESQKLDELLRPLVAKFNLGDVGLNIVDRIANNASGSYSGIDKLIEISMTGDKPLQTMRHESMHALRDLEFFSPQQWNALTERANKQWIKEYLEDQTSEVEVDGKMQTMSRLDAYKKLGYSQEAIIEEAVADAFGAYERGAKPPPGLIAALFKKLKDFFKNFGQALRGAGFESSEDIFERVERGELKSRKPKKVEVAEEPETKLSVRNTIKGLMNPSIEPKYEKIINDVAEEMGLTPEEFASTSLAFQTGKAGTEQFESDKIGGLPEVVQFLQDQRRNSGLPLLDTEKPEDRKMIAKLMATEAMAAIRSGGANLEWYDSIINKTLAMAGLKYPELNTDINARMAFRIATAITSQGLNVEDNLAFAMKVYDQFRKNGKFPEVGQGADQGAMINNFKLANYLMDDLKPNMMRQFLETEFTVEELRSAGFNIAGELGDEKVLGSSVFGPKIGFGFYSNLNGNFDPVTMDMWFMRTIGRLTGKLKSFRQDLYDAQLDKFRAALDVDGSNGVFANQFDQDEVELAKVDDKAAEALARKVKSAHERDYKINRAGFDDGTREKSKLVAVSETMIKSLDAPKDSPANGSERRNLRDVVRQMVDIVQEKYGKRVPPASLQAVIWYPEQELYKAMGVKLRVTSQNYAGAIEKILKGEGYGESDLGAAAKLGSRTAQQLAKSAVAKRPKEAGGEPVRLGSLQAGEKEALLERGRKRVVLAEEKETPKRKRVIFEVAPDPNNKALTAKWKSLSNEERIEISDKIGNKIIKTALDKFGLKGYVDTQVGSYLDDTNPSFALYLESGDSVAMANFLGYALSQDSMMVVSPKPAKGLDKTGSVRIKVGDLEARDVDKIYQKLREIEVDGEKPVGGQSYMNGHMVVLNYSNVPTKELAVLINNKLGKDFEVITEDVYTAFPEKKDYNYDDPSSDPRGNAGVLRQASRDTRSEAARLLQKELAAPKPKAAADTKKLSLRTAPTTPEFKRFFGDSKVVNKDGNPKVMYHGTSKDVTDFTRKEMRGAPIFLTDDPAFADRFALDSVDVATARVEQVLSDEQIAGGRKLAIAAIRKDYRARPEGKVMIDSINTNDYSKATPEAKEYLRKAYAEMMPSGPNVMPVYVSAQNPFDYDKPANVKKVVAALKENVGDYPIQSTDRRMVRIKDVGAVLQSGNWNFIESEDVQQAIKDAGFDSFYVREHGIKNLAVYKSAQVKSAIGNDGTYGVGESDVRYSLKNVSFPSVKAVKEAVETTGIPKTDAFKQFIAGNQWVDKDGGQKVFYHATARDFFEFTPAGKTSVIYLSDTPEEAEVFGKIAEDRLRQQVYRALTKDEKIDFFQRLVDAKVEKGSMAENEGANFIRQAKRKIPDFGKFGDLEKEVRAGLIDLSPTRMSIMPLYARAETPFDFRNPEHIAQVASVVRRPDPKLSEKAIKEARELRMPSEYPDNWYRGLPGLLKQGFLTSIEQEPVQTAIRKLGFDGYVGRQNRNSPVVYAVYKPEQVKSVTGNIGEYGRESKDIRFSLPTIPTNIDDRVNETTFTRERKGFAQRMIEAITPQSAASFRARFLNRYNQLSVYDKKLAEQMGGAVLLADQSAESAALFSDVGAGIAASAMGMGDRNGGIPVLRNGVTTIDTSVKGLVASLAPLAAYNDPKIYQYYQYWAMVKRGQRLDKQGKLTGITTTDVAYAKAIEAKFPKDLFNNVQKDLIAFNNGLVKYMVDTGVLSKERGAEYTKYADYVPFYRQMDGENTLGPNLFQSLSGVKAPKKLKGAIAEEAPLADFLETMVRNTQSAIQAGIKNYAGQRAINVASQVNAPGMGVTRLKTPSTAPNVINVLERGVLTSYETADNLLIEAVKSLNLSDLPFMGILSAPADLLRNLVTKDPGFMMANLLRDSLSAYVTSGVKMTPVVDTVMSFGKSLTRNSPTFEALLNAGIISGYDSGNIEKSGLNLEKDLAKKAGQKDALLLRPFTSLWDALEKGTTASDAATRVVIYERVMAETGNEAEALFRSMEVMNFHRKGSSALIRVLTAAVPFFNARLQGLDLFYRASTGNMNNKDAAAIQRQFFVRGMTMMALSAAYWFMVSDDEEYKKQEQETKDNNWLIPALGIRIPIPFEVGVLFKTIPERIAAYTFGNDTGQDLRDSLFRNAVSTFAFNPIPQTVKPLVEAAFNVNTFTFRPIVSEGMQDVDPQYQVGPGTSSVAKGIAGVLGLSPMKVDHVIKGYTGTLGMYGVDTLDMVMDQFGDSPRATKRFEQLPVIKRFALDPEARGNVTEYYKLKDSVDSVVRTMNFLEKQGESEEYVEYLKENQGTFAFKDYIRDTEKTMKELRQMKSAVQISKMSGDEKRDAITGINRAENAINAEIQRIKTIISSSQ
jgi:hypothetical protein